MRLDTPSFSSSSCRFALAWMRSNSLRPIWRTVSVPKERLVGLCTPMSGAAIAITQVAAQQWCESGWYDGCGLHAES